MRVEVDSKIFGPLRFLIASKLSLSYSDWALIVILNCAGFEINGTATTYYCTTLATKIGTGRAYRASLTALVVFHFCMIWQTSSLTQGRSEGGGGGGGGGEGRLLPSKNFTLPA